MTPSASEIRIRRSRTSPPTSQRSREPAQTAEAPTDGKSIFTASCGTCHTLADAGTAGAVGPNLDEAKPDKALVVDRVTNGQGAMPSFKDSLDSQQIEAVAEYVSSAAGQ